ncbi:MAG: type II secretion system F family protein [Patescibacteria group bacterium]
MEFSYRARNKNGQVETDILEAASRGEALGELHTRGLIPLSLTEKRAGLSIIKNIFSGIRPVPLLDKITFLRNLSVMMKAGLSLPRALQILSAQAKEGKFKQILLQISSDVRSGKSLSESLHRYPQNFGPLYISLIQVGESGGNLDKNLEYLVGYLRRDYELIKKTKGALTYPIVVFVALVIVVILMFTFILPKLTDTFTELHVELPWTTKVLVATVNAFSSYSYVIVAAMVVLAVGIRLYFRSEFGRRSFHKLNLHLPVVKNAAQRLNLARFTLTLSSLLNSSMPIVEAVRVAGRSMTNVYFAEAALEASEKVMAGVPLSDALNNYPNLFPTLMVQMVKVGEESGTTVTILEELNRFYEEELDEFLKNLSSIIEPVMVMFIGVIVGFLAMALISPIYSISQSQ